MPNMKWKDAIEQILRESGQAMHYSDIADSIINRKLRADVGATPSATVCSVINTDMNNNKDSVFFKVGSGEFILKEFVSGPSPHKSPVPGNKKNLLRTELSEEKSAGIISAFGMYWRRGLVHWTSNPKILGQQKIESHPIDFSEQIGVYLLHDSRNVVYVGRTIEQPLGRRLYMHTLDRLNGRWDRFSWFGIKQVTEDAKLIPANFTGLNENIIIATMEALLIEGLEPSQNRKRGDDFRAIEYLQVSDPGIQKLEIIERIKTMMG